MLSLALIALLAADAPAPTRLSDADRIAILNAQVALLQAQDAKHAAEKKEMEEGLKFQSLLASIYEKYKLAPSCQIQAGSHEIKCKEEPKK